MPARPRKAFEVALMNFHHHHHHRAGKFDHLENQDVCEKKKTRRQMGAESKVLNRLNLALGTLIQDCC